MKIITKIDTNNYKDYQNLTNALLLPLNNYSVGYNKTFSIEEIEKIDDFDIYTAINKNIYNSDIEELKEVLVRLDNMNIKGIFFYDIALIPLKKELNLKMDLVLDITHMVNNHDLINYLSSEGINMVKLNSELTLNEIIEIKKNTKIPLIYNYLGIEDVAFSKRKLLTNNNEPKKEVTITEKVSNQEFIVKEDNLGTSALEELVNNNIDYIFLNEDFIDHEIFIEVLEKTNEVLDNKDYSFYQEEINKLIGAYNSFLYKDTIYKVKDDE